MEHFLKPGTWCRPANETQWNFILDMAESIGMGDDREYPYSKNRRIWANDVDGKVYPMSDDIGHGNPTDVSVFIYQMMQEAELRKEMEKDVVVFTGQSVTIVNPLDTIVERLEKLEAKVFAPAQEKTSGLTFTEAAQLAQQGKDVRRGGCNWSLRGVAGYSGVVATDWEVVP